MDGWISLLAYFNSISRVSIAVLQLWCRRRSIAKKNVALNLDEWIKLYGFRIHSSLAGSNEMPMDNAVRALISRISQPFAHQIIMAKECSHMPSQTYGVLDSVLRSKIKFNLKCGAMKPRNDRLLAPMPCLSNNLKISQRDVTALRHTARDGMEMLLLFGAAVSSH